MKFRDSIKRKKVDSHFQFDFSDVLFVSAKSKATQAGLNASKQVTIPFNPA